MDGSFGMQPRWPSTLHVVWFGDYAPIFIAFDAAAAREFADAENAEVECEIMEVHEVVLVDDFGFHCRPADKAVLAIEGHFDGCNGPSMK
jgi:hypothetical protein